MEIRVIKLSVKNIIYIDYIHYVDEKNLNCTLVLHNCFVPIILLLTILGPRDCVYSTV